MADFATSLRSLLVADAGVAGVVSTRIYWGIVPQTATLPYVRLSIISDVRPEHLKGYLASRRTRVRASCFANSFGAAKQLGAKIVKASQTPSSNADGRIGRIKAEGPRTASDMLDEGGDTPAGYIHHQIVDLMMEHSFDD